MLFGKKWFTCAVHSSRYPAGSSCAKCARGINPVTRKAASVARPKVATNSQPFKCKCGRLVTNSQGICPGPDC